MDEEKALGSMLIPTTGRTLPMKYHSMPAIEDHKDFPSFVILRSSSAADMKHFQLVIKEPAINKHRLPDLVGCTCILRKLLKFLLADAV